MQRCRIGHALAVDVLQEGGLIAAVQQQRSAAALMSAEPDLLFLHHRVEIEQAQQRLRKANLQLIVKVVQLRRQHHALQLAVALAAPRAPCPHRFLDAAILRQRRRQPFAGRFMQQAHRFIQVGFAAAVGAGDNVELPEFHFEETDGAVVGEGELFDHVGRVQKAGARYHAPPGVTYGAS